MMGNVLPLTNPVQRDALCFDCRSPMAVINQTASGICKGCCDNREIAQRVRRSVSVAAATLRANIPAKVLLDLTRFEPTAEQRAMRSALRAIVYGSAKLPWLFAHGPVGTGKTHEAGRAAFLAVVLGKRVRFATSTSLLLALRGTYAKDSRTSAAELLERYTSADLLVLDDVGSEKPTPAAVDVLFRVIDERYSEMRPTIITSNLSLPQLCAHLAPSDETAQAKRVVDRVYELSSVFPLDGKSHRLTGTPSGDWARFRSLLRNVETKANAPGIPAAVRNWDTEAPAPLREWEIELARFIPDLDEVVEEGDEQSTC